MPIPEGTDEDQARDQPGQATGEDAAKDEEGPAAVAEEEEQATTMPPPPPTALRQELEGRGARGGGANHPHPQPNNHHLPWYARLDVFRFCRCLRLLGSVMCVIVLLLFGVSWYAVAVGVYGPVVRGVGPRGEGASLAGRAGAALLVLAFSALCALSLWSYFVAVGTDAGRVPAGWHPFETDAAAEAELRGLGIVAVVEGPSPGGGGGGGGDDDEDGGEGDEDEEEDGGGGNNGDGDGSFVAGSPFRHNHPLFPPCPPAHTTAIHQRPVAAAAAASANAAAANAVPYTGDPRDPRRPRWCRRCHCWKPPRAHHCSASGRCVLKMDHYCIWVVNCVGLLNYKAFFLFLLYTCLSSAVAAAALVPAAVRFFTTLAPDGALAVAFVALAMDAAFAIALAAFVGMHASLVRSGCTTIEMYEKERPGRWPYQRGSFLLNLEDVCGPRPWGAASGAAMAASTAGGVWGVGEMAGLGVPSAAGGLAAPPPPASRGRWRRVAEAARWLLAPTHSREAERALLEECLGPRRRWQAAEEEEERRGFLAAAGLSNGGGGGAGAGAGGADGGGGGGGGGAGGAHGASMDSQV